MAKTIYICEKCKFAFERVGDVESCPDWGASGIRTAEAAEAEEYRRIRPELENDEN